MKIFATDLDTKALETASVGTYPGSIVNDMTPERLERYFNHNGHEFQVKRSLREMLIIAPHDLTKNAGFSKMNMVFCRNVLIYMQPQLQQQVIRLLHFSLAETGILFLGNSETLADLSGEFDPLEVKNKIYRKRGDLKLSLIPLTREPIIPAIQSNTGLRSHQIRLDRIMGEVFKFCLQKQSITCVLINKENQLLHVFYNDAKLLEFPVGQAHLAITDVVIPSLKFPLSTAIHRVKRDKKSVSYSNIKFERDGKHETINLRISFDQDISIMSDYLIVVFELVSQVDTSSEKTLDINPEAMEQLGDLEYELQQTRQNLQFFVRS